MRLVSTSVLLLAALAAVPQVAAAQGYIETDLVSDISGRAPRTDPNLANPWGLVPGPSGVFWVSNNVTNTSTLYQPDGTINPLVVSVPGGPTGVVVSTPGESTFVFQSGDSSARAVFIFATASGTIAAWNPGTPTT